MKKNTVELVDEKNQLIERQNEIISCGEKEVRELTEIENSEINEINEKITLIDSEILTNEEESKRAINNGKKITTEKRMENFSLLNALNNMVNNNGNYSEGERSLFAKTEEEYRKAGLTPEGKIQVPYDLRSITALGVNGSQLIQSDVLSPISELSANLVITQAGAQMLNQVNNVVLPLIGKATSLWKGEIASAEDGNVTFGTKELKPNRLTSYLPVSKLFLKQTGNQSIENLLINELQRSVSEKLEETLLSASAGTADQPAGLFYGATSGVTATYATITEYQATLENKNVKDFVWIMNPSAKAKLKAVKINEGQMLIQNELMDGRKIYTSSLVPDNGVILGDFHDFIIAQFGQIDLDFNPRPIQGEVDIVINGYFDANKLRDSFIAFVLA